MTIKWSKLNLLFSQFTSGKSKKVNNVLVIDNKSKLMSKLLSGGPWTGYLWTGYPWTGCPWTCRASWMVLDPWQHHYCITIRLRTFWYVLIRFDEFGRACSRQLHRVRPPPAQKWVIIYSRVPRNRWCVRVLLHEPAKTCFEAFQCWEASDIRWKQVE
jgi:hypothetical protein